MVRHEHPPVEVPDVDRLFELVRAGFATRRKTLRNTLAGRIDADQFARAQVDPQARAETLSLDDWARLAHA
jgi:16S rRNA (adenine1518-N6/adenine1519-N6)-dimethyltransferase